jgi:hypothetical protein
VTGDVEWEGENGILITSEYVEGAPVLRFDAVGVPTDCGLGSPVKCLKTSQVGEGRALVIEQEENVIVLTTPYTLPELCAADSELPDGEGNLPDDEDMCNPPVPPPCTPPPPHSHPCPLEHYSEYYIWPDGDTISVNVTEWASGDLAVTAQGGQLPARPVQALKFYMKGI